jgi:hypothetical protein
VAPVEDITVVGHVIESQAWAHHTPGWRARAEDRSGLIPIAVIVGEAELAALVGREQDRCAECFGIPVGKITVVCHITAIAIAADLHDAHAHDQYIRHGHEVANGISAEVAEVAIAQVELPAVVHLRGHRIDQHRAAGIVAAKQGLLYASQHLHATDIEVIKQRAVVPCQIDIIDIDADGGIEGNVGPWRGDATQRNIGVR